MITEPLGGSLVTTTAEPTSLRVMPAEERLQRIRALATSSLAPLGEALERGGVDSHLQEQLARVGAFSVHLHRPGEFADRALSLQLISALARVCGSNGVGAGCLAALGLYVEESADAALQGACQERNLRGDGFGATGLVTPSKAYAGIEELLLRAIPAGDGNRLRGSLAWVNDLMADGYSGVIATVNTTVIATEVHHDGTPAVREAMVLLHASAPGAELRFCPGICRMKGISSVTLRSHDACIGPGAVISHDTASFIVTPYTMFPLLQSSFGHDVIRGVVDSILAVQSPLERSTVTSPIGSEPSESHGRICGRAVISLPRRPEARLWLPGWLCSKPEPSVLTSVCGRPRWLCRTRGLAALRPVHPCPDASVHRTSGRSSLRPSSSGARRFTPFALTVSHRNRIASPASADRPFFSHSFTMNASTTPTRTVTRHPPPIDRDGLLAFAERACHNPASRGTSRFQTVNEGQSRILRRFGDDAPVLVEEPLHRLQENTTPPQATSSSRAWAAACRRHPGGGHLDAAETDAAGAVPGRCHRHRGCLGNRRGPEGHP